MLYLFIGQVRNGKTISAVCELKKFYDEGYTIYSNTFLNFPFKPITREMILKRYKEKINFEAKSVCFIDELDKWFSSRNSMSSNNKIFSYFITQLGKFTEDKQKGLTLIGTTQFFTQMDIIGRRIVSKICECKKIREQKDEYIDVLRVWKRNNNLVLKTYKKEVVRFIKEDFELYDTQQEIMGET